MINNNLLLWTRHPTPIRKSRKITSCSSPKNPGLSKEGRNKLPKCLQQPNNKLTMKHVIKRY
jgi:hypothetical protein